MLASRATGQWNEYIIVQCNTMHFWHCNPDTGYLSDFLSLYCTEKTALTVLHSSRHRWTPCVLNFAARPMLLATPPPLLVLVGKSKVQSLTASHGLVPVSDLLPHY